MEIHAEDLKIGMTVLLRNGYEADITGNITKNTCEAKVYTDKRMYGHSQLQGIYLQDIDSVISDNANL